MPSDLSFKMRKAIFCKMHLKQIKQVGYITSSKPTQGWWKTPEVMALLAAARKEIGYSAKTVDIDILHSLFKLQRKLDPDPPQ